MKDPKVRMISVAEALRIVLENASPLPVERVNLQQARNRVLAQEVRADADQPPFEKAMMDGYALRSADLKEIPAELEVVAEIPAGKNSTPRLESGQTARIMTGAPVPQGADAIQMVERTESLQEGSRVRILESVQAGTHIAPRGQEVRAGETILSEGQILTPPRMGLLASVGCVHVKVRRSPRVLVASTGDELVEAHQRPAHGQIRNSNGPALTARLRGWGADAVSLGIVRDDHAALDETIRLGLEQDLLIFSGGVSMGVHDLVEEALDRRGIDLLFRKVAIRPGKPVVFGRKGSCLILGLPGNPVSSLVVLQVLAGPLIRGMLGIRETTRDRFEAILVESVCKRAGREAYLPGTLLLREGKVTVQPIPTTGSADLLAHSRADVLFVVPAEREKVEAGERVKVLPLN